MAEAEQQKPSEEELRERIEEQLRTVRVQDILLESIAGILNLAARRIAKEDERDLEQGRIGIDAARALVDLLDPEPARQVRDALAELQVLYAKHASEAPAAANAPAGGEDDPSDAPRPEPTSEPGPEPRGERPASSRLWTPPGSK
jgi:hypothetical protein